MSISHEVVHSLKWVTISKFSAQIIRWVVTFLVIRILTPDDYGLMAMALVVLSFFEVFATAGLGTALIQAKSYTETQVRELFGMIVLVNVLLALGMVFIAPQAAEYYREDRIIPLIYGLQFALVISAFEALPSAMLTRNLRFKARGLSELAASVIAALITLWLAVTGKGVWALILGYLCEMVLRAIFLNLVNPVLSLPRFWFNHSAQLLSFGGMKTVTVLAWFIFSSIDVIIGGRLWTAEVLGVYAVAIQLSYIPLNKLTPIVKQVALPVYSKLHHQPQSELAPYFIKANGLTMLVAFPVFFGLAAIAPTLVPLLLGEKWLEVIIPASLIPLILPFRMSQELMDPVLEAIGRPKEATKNWLITILGVAPSLYIGALYGELLGMCIAWVVSMPLIYLLVAKRTLARIEVSGSELAGSVLRPMFAAFLMLATVWGIHLSAEGVIPALPLLVVEVVSGALVYVGLVRVVCRSQFEDAWKMVRKLKKK